MSSIRRVVVAGGGVAALEAVLSLLELAPQLEVELISAGDRFVNRPLSVLEPFSATNTRTLPLARLADRGVHVVQGRVERVEPTRQHVLLAGGETRPYDALVVALGARPRRVVEGALTFRGPQDADALTGLVQDVEDGVTSRVAFVVPPGTTWALPLYELVLQTASLARRHSRSVELTVVTSEAHPLEAFGRTGTALAECLLEEAGVMLADTVPADAERVVALPRLDGVPLAGLPVDGAGFLPVDGDGRVRGVAHVYAAGDGTDHEIKQGGLAAQQADRAVGALLDDHHVPATVPPPEPPQLRAMLLTGDEVWYLRRREGDADGEVSRRPLWWPPSKLAGLRLAPFLDEQSGTRQPVRRRAAIVRGPSGHVAIHKAGRR